MPQTGAIVSPSFCASLSCWIMNFIIPHNMGYHFTKHVSTQGCNPPCVVTLLNGNVQLIPQQSVPNDSIAIAGSFALRRPPWAWWWHGRRCPRLGSTILHVPTITLHELYVCRFCFSSIFVWLVFGIRESMNLSTCFCPIVVYARSTTNENNIVSTTLKEFVQQHCMLKPY